MTVILNLGGTINTAYKDGKPVDKGIRGILGSSIDVINIMPVSSNNLEWEHLKILRDFILEKKKSKETRFLVATGTDTLEEVAYFLSLIIPADVSLVVVGALRLRSDPNSDGEQWLSLANNWLNEKTSHGIAICCGGPLIVGTEVEKVYQNGWTFRPLSDTGDGLLNWSLKEKYRLLPTPCVPILSVGIGVGSWLATILEMGNFDGVVIEAYAAGDVPSNLFEPIKRLLSAHVPVILASKSRPGLIEPLYPGTPGCSHDLLSTGALGAGKLDSRKARIRLMVVLAARPRIPTKAAFRAQDEIEFNE